MLEKIALQARKTKNAAKGHKNVMQAAETAIIDIELPDNRGNLQKLSSYTSNGRPTLVIFSMLTDKDSPEVTRHISQLYSQYKDRYNFYQVCLDADITSWHEASKALPWTLVDRQRWRLIAHRHDIQRVIATQHSSSTMLTASSPPAPTASTSSLA